MSQAMFHASKRESAVDTVVNNIKQLLIERKLKPGDKLPSELELSESMGVSRGSVREAMKILSAGGLVDIKVGNGTYVCDTPGNALLDTFLFSFFVTNPNMEDMYEFRVMLEIDILQLILKHRDENTEDRRRMGENLEELRHLMENGGTTEELTKNDLAFHRIMGHACCNILMERIYGFIIDFLTDSIRKTHERQHGEYVYTTHKRIYDVIENNDITRVEEAITASIDVWSTLQDPYSHSGNASATEAGRAQDAPAPGSISSQDTKITK